MRYRIAMHIDYYYDVMLALDPINQSKSWMSGQRMSCGVTSEWLIIDESEYKLSVNIHYLH